MISSESLTSLKVRGSSECAKMIRQSGRSQCQDFTGRNSKSAPLMNNFGWSRERRRLRLN